MSFPAEMCKIVGIFKWRWRRFIGEKGWWWIDDWLLRAAHKFIFLFQFSFNFVYPRVSVLDFDARPLEEWAALQPNLHQSLPVKNLDTDIERINFSPEGSRVKMRKEKKEEAMMIKKIKPRAQEERCHVLIIIQV